MNVKKREVSSKYGFAGLISQQEKSKLRVFMDLDFLCFPPNTMTPTSNVVCMDDEGVEGYGFK